MVELERITPGEGSDETATGYSCEAACIDWYGNARPIFIERSVLP